MSRDVPCSSCNETAEWVVAYSYDGERAPGRILAYCTRCRREKEQSVLVSIPIELVSDEVFVALYREGFTESVPDYASEIVFGVERPDLVRRVVEYLDEDLRASMMARFGDDESGRSSI